MTISVTCLIIFAIHNVFYIEYYWINLLLKWHLTLNCLDKFGPANKLNINYKSYIIMQRDQSPANPLKDDRIICTFTQVNPCTETLTLLLL